MKNILSLLLALCAVIPAAAEYVPKDARIGMVYSIPTGKVYDSAMGVEMHYRLWYWETTAVSIIGAIQQWDLSDSSPLAEEPGFSGFKAAPAYVQLGVGLDERRDLSEHIRLNLHADLRYYNGLSGAKVRIRDTAFSREQPIDVSDAVVASLGAGIEFNVTREWTFYTELGAQAGILPGEIASGNEKMDNEFEAIVIRAGALFTF